VLLDDIRGITTSSARREWPSAVFGISTPGPVDKDGPMNRYGKKEYEINNMPSSRLGGSSFVMDDGDDKFLRASSASVGPPEYAAVEDGETNGDRKLLHNELVRIRTRTGHQILLHNTEDLIYIGNARGTSWIELTSDGKIDIYAEDSISVHTTNDLNFYADRDINIECGRNFNTKVGGEMQTEVIENQNLIVKGKQTTQIKDDVSTTFAANYLHTVLGNFDLKTTGNNTFTADENTEVNSGGNNNFTAGGGTNLLSSGSHIETAAVIHMNGPSAATAAKATKAALPKELKTHSVPNQEGTELYKSIMRRVPSHEPWPHHENLDPTEFKPDKTDRDIDGRNKVQGSENADFLYKPEYFKKYTTKYDTFSKVKK
jgi:hypothetical protein